MNRRALALIPAAMLLSLSIILSPVPAKAHFATTPNLLPGKTAAVFASPTPAHLSGPVDLTLCAGGDPIVIDGAGVFPLHIGSTFFPQVLGVHPTSLVPLECHTWSAPSDFPGLVLTAGSYSFVVDNGTEPIFVEFNVTFFMLPESPISAIAITGSSLAVLGAFVGLRRFKMRFYAHLITHRVMP